MRDSRAPTHPLGGLYLPPGLPSVSSPFRPVGSKGDSFDNALAETVNGLYKTELIHRRGPWRTADQVELATAEWVQWWNERRLHGACGEVPPAEYEAAYYRALVEGKEVA